MGGGVMAKRANTQETRHEDGKFKPGVSGNPNGRPKIPQDVIDAARAHTETAIATLVSMCQTSEDDKVRVQAAEAILNRAWGKPTERQEITGANGGPVQQESVVRPQMTVDEYLKFVRAMHEERVKDGVDSAAGVATSGVPR